jgi:hypothetical protein
MWKHCVLFVECTSRVKEGEVPAEPLSAMFYSADFTGPVISLHWTRLRGKSPGAVIGRKGDILAEFIRQVATDVKDVRTTTGRAVRDINECNASIDSCGPEELEEYRRRLQE